MCGDSTSIDAVDKLMDGQKPNTMVTDPPYGVELDQSWRDDALGSKALGKGNAGLVENDDQADWTDVWALFYGQCCLCLACVKIYRCCNGEFEKNRTGAITANNLE